MLEVDVSHAKRQFDTLLNQEVVIVDDEYHTKKAVLLPYNIYDEIMRKVMRRDNLLQGSFNQFQGMLSQDFKTSDSRYNAIING